MTGEPLRTLLIGKIGQVGWELRRTLAPMGRLTCVDFPEIDLTDADSIRRWVRELALVPDRYIHEPWKMPLEVQRQAKCLIGHDYPAPIVEHAWARQRALEAYNLTT